MSLMKQDFTTKDGPLSFLSSFWSLAFPDQGFVQGVGRSYALQAAQAYQDAIEVINTASLDKTPLYHRELVMPITLVESEMSIGPLPISYGSGIVYGDQPGGSIYREGDIFEYGGRERLSSFYYFPVQEDVVSVGSVLTERLVNPLTILAKDRDFIIIDRRVVAFLRNPFEAGAFPVRTDAGGERTIIAWAHEAHIDKGFLHRRWGFPFFSSEVSTEAMRGFCRSMFSLYAKGPSRLMLDSFVSAMARQPVVSEVVEVVETVAPFDGEQLVVTDKSVYHVPHDVELRPEVFPGARLSGGFPLTKVTQVDDILSDPKWWQTEGGITLNRALQHPDYFGGAIYLPNKDVVAVAHGDASARFEVSGTEDAVRRFWEKVDAGSPDGNYLGYELWKRKGVVDEDGEPDLSRPLLVNPMGLIVEDILGVSIVAVRVVGGQVPDMREFLENMRNLHRGTAPGALLIFFIDYQLSSEYDPSGTAGALGVSMGLGIYEEDFTLSGITESLNTKQSISH